MRVWLHDFKENRCVEAHIVLLAPSHIERINATWVPQFHERYLAQWRDEDFLSWKTGAKYESLLVQHSAQNGHAIECDGELQGVLFLQSSPETSRLDSGACVVCVRYLATAPWNRPSRDGSGRYRRTGTLLLARAVLESIERGCGGALGLHALEGSDRFYRKLGFLDLGADAAHRGLRYFELATPQADRLLAQLAVKPTIQVQPQRESEPAQ